MTAITFRFILGLLLLISWPVLARDVQTEIKQLQGVLNVINGELQAAYQQYQMIVEARRSAIAVELYGMLTDPTRPAEYVAVQKEKENAFRTDRQLSEQMDQILGRIRELEARKQPILERVYSLVSEYPLESPKPAETQTAPIQGMEIPPGSVTPLPSPTTAPRSEKPFLEVPTPPAPPAIEAPSVYSPPGS